jgi:hypothetical protein
MTTRYLVAYGHFNRQGAREAKRIKHPPTDVGGYKNF